MRLVQTAVNPPENGCSPQTPITHGICPQCSEELSGVKKYQLHEFLDTLSQPILLTGSDGAIRTANKTAQKMLGKPLTDSEGYPGGEVTERMCGVMLLRVDGATAVPPATVQPIPPPLIKSVTQPGKPRGATYTDPSNSPLSGKCGWANRCR